MLRLHDWSASRLRTGPADRTFRSVARNNTHVAIATACLLCLRSIARSVKVH